MPQFYVAKHIKGDYIMSLMDLKVDGFLELIYTFIEGIVNLNIKEMDLDYLGQVLTIFGPVLNPIWDILIALMGMIGLQ